MSPRGWLLIGLVGVLLALAAPAERGHFTTAWGMLLLLTLGVAATALPWRRIVPGWVPYPGLFAVPRGSRWCATCGSGVPPGPSCRDCGASLRRTESQ